MKDHIKLEVQMYRRLRHPCALREIIWKKGRPYNLFPEKKIKLQQAKQCFRNAFYLADANNWIYVEGFGLVPEIPMLIHHAWAYDPATDIMYDNTWPDAINCQYYGIQFEVNFVKRYMAKTRVYGMLGHEMKDLFIIEQLKKAKKNSPFKGRVK